MKYLVILTVLLLVSSASFGQSLNRALTFGLTSVITERTGNTFTWTLVNNTGSGDDIPEWDVLVWTLQPFGVHAPVRVDAPEGWEWVSRGYSRFEIKSSNAKYQSGPAIAPGESLVFRYEFDPLASMVNGLDSPPTGPAFLTHVAAVLPESMQDGGIVRWTPTTVNGTPSWYDQSSNPEPSAILAMLAWATGTVGLVVKKKRVHSSGRDCKSLPNRL